VWFQLPVIPAYWRTSENSPVIIVPNQQKKAQVSNMEKKILGIDAGGTFTDFVLLSVNDGDARLRVHKVLSTPDAPERAILQGIADLDLDEWITGGRLHIIHGSTVATNAALENKGVRTAFVTNTGFADLLTLARQTRPNLYQLEFPPQPPPVPRELCLETGGRISAQGEVLEPLSEAQLDALLAQIRELRPAAVAINLLFSFVDDRFERAIEQALQPLASSVFICRSSQVLPEYREYERGIATWLNASLGPVVGGYLTRLRERLGNSSLQIMQSSGETFSATTAAERAVNLLLSGPAAGLAAIRDLGQRLGEKRVISFDMGGTSTDVALLDGALRITNEGRVAGYPVAVPMVDMHTIGAGGGSIAFLDGGGMLRVGPESAGADPGPACYGHGGQRPTVTDANLLLGRLQLDEEGVGHLELDRQMAQQAIAGLAQSMGLGLMETALGIIEIANEHMISALRMISVQRGFDPADFMLASFGGAGGLHVCALAEAMGMDRAVVPVNAGVLSALGMLVAPCGRQFSRTVGIALDTVDDHELQGIYEDMLQAASAELAQEGLTAGQLTADRSADLRYQGQSFSLTVPWRDKARLIADFQQQHLDRYGFHHEASVELVNLRIRLTAVSEPVNWPRLVAQSPHRKPVSASVFGHSEPVPVWSRESLEADSRISGPAIITEYSATTWVPESWNARIDELGNILLTRPRQPVRA